MLAARQSKALPVPTRHPPLAEKLREMDGPWGTVGHSGSTCWRTLLGEKHGYKNEAILITSASYAQIMEEEKEGGGGGEEEEEEKEEGEEEEEEEEEEVEEEEEEEQASRYI
ncbi:hypothetical protein PoB_003277600 [Plakobranchus ocellatus]|uniref:Uncharacterized protein n=1 Tax=Plakobranchus ocellatus TaxID=259542 RepID=A0AAV4AI30_9GAST|nr:hypothetical protein PoB_003277600 [Plakobranchus ocellatus]